MSPVSPPPRPADASYLLGGGDMGARMRTLDWSTTALGPFEGWPQSLRSAVSTCLGSRFPIVLYWGAERVVLYNDAYAEILGGKHPWALGRPCREVWSEIWDVIEPMLDGVAATGEATWSEDQLLLLERRGYPEECYFSFSFSPVRGEAGAVDGIFTAVIESTGRVLGERRLALLAQLAADSTARTVRDACAQATRTLAGKPDVPFALVYLERGAADELVAATPAAAAARDAARPEHVKALPIPGGRLIVGLNPRRPLDDQQGAFLDLVAGQLGTAIGNARAYEEERGRAEALATLDRAKTAFFSNVSHEFRTPLTLLLGTIEELLATTGAGAPTSERAALEVVRRNAQRLLRLVNTLLDFARIEAGRAQASYEPIDLGAFTAELASNFRSACDRAGVRLAVDCPSLDEAAYVDPEMWETIVLNLLSNAFKFTLRGAIAVRLRRVGPTFELTVRDTGSGIPEASLPRMFERFHRVEGAVGRSHEGSGIGLALVHELVKLHGGTIGVTSRVGEGSTFAVSIPAGAAHLPAERLRPPRPAPSTALRAGAFVDEAMSWLPAGTPPYPTKEGARRVLLADDNADLRDYVRRLLSEHYEVEAVVDGEAALAAARARKPDLVVTDLMMPRLDGFGLIRALRADAELRAIPVLALSARAGEEARVEGLGQGADDYLVKPFSARELLVRAEALLRSQDIRREAGEALRASEDRYRQLLGLMPAGVYACEAPSGVITYYNEHAAKLWGRAPGIGDTEERFCGSYKLWTVDGTFMRRDETPMAVALRTGRSFRDQEAVVERPDGTHFSVVVNIDPIRDAGGRVTGAINVFYDVTDRVRAEAALRASQTRLAGETRALARLNEASSRLWRMPTLQEGFQEILNATIELLGADKGNLQMLDGGVLRIAAQRGFESEFLECFREVSVDDPSACGRALHGRSRTVVEDVEEDPSFAPFRAVARTAGYRAVQSTPLLGRDGQLLGVISTHWRDPHRPDEQELRRLDLYSRQVADFIERCRAEERLREADRRKDEFIAVLSHELRNPLAPLRNALELLRLRDGADPGGKARAMMDRQVQQLARLVDDLLETSRISSGLLELRQEPVPLAQVLATAVETAEPVVREAGHRLFVEGPSEPVWVMADAIRLAQSFANLINNAARYTPRGGRIWLRTSRGADGGVRIAVRDTGVGFSAEAADRLFELFVRGESSKGLGIGLSLVRKLVEMHGGTVEARSEGPGRGAEFVVVLPRIEAPPRDLAGAPSSPRADTGKYRVLVADDNHDAAESLALLLRALGSDVSVAHDGMEAVEKARAFRPHVVLLDIGMPRLDGYGAAREMRRDPALSAARLVALTGWGQDDDRRRVREAGFDDHLVKPAELASLRRVLDGLAR